MLGVNSSLHVIGVGFQLYGQLKKSLHDGTGVLGSSAVSTASQTTRLGKSSSVMTWDERTSWRSYYSEIYLKWILKYVIIISFSFFGLYPIISPYSQALLCYLIISPMSTCLVHNCEISWGLLYFHLLSPLSQDQIPFDPHQWCRLVTGTPPISDLV